MHMSKVYISEDANPLLKEYLSGSNHTIVEIKSTEQVYESISSHPDIFMCKINNQLIKSENDLGYSYPENIKYNGVQVGKYFIDFYAVPQADSGILLFLTVISLHILIT